MNHSSFKRVLLASTAFAFAAALTACGEPVEKSLVKQEAAPVAAADSAPVVDVADIISRAQASHEKSVAMSHGWTRTQPLINKASDALTSGETDAAQEMAERALGMADAAVAQAEIEKTAWQARVPK